MDRRVAALLAATVTCLGVLGASGVWLSVRYRPDPPGSLAPGVFRLPNRGGGWIGDVHHVAALVFYVLVAGVVLAVLISVGRQGRWMGAVPMVAVVTATVVAQRSGRALPWSQLALWAVKVNINYEGVWRAAYEPTVRFVLGPTGEVAPADYRVDVVTHIFAAPMVLAVAFLGAAVCLWRRRERPTPTPR